MRKLHVFSTSGHAEILVWWAELQALSFIYPHSAVLELVYLLVAPK